ncbi:MAG: carbohydrate kinase family protein [Spirochaeta sp.]|jgi:sugar/nucleoside kinase (ribokinase family)|nr:carbohydrate kinase family protein [Spirochaeta sp.]
MRLNGAGCSLIDNLYSDVDFDGDPFTAVQSRRDGDGGIIPGGLVFAEDLAEFTDSPYEDVLYAITGKSAPDSCNLGGPAIIPLVHAAQLLVGNSVETAYYGLRGDDNAADRIERLLDNVPIDLTAYRRVAGPTPSTDVLSDPTSDDGRGERSFVNRIGVAGDPRTAEPNESFFNGDIAFFGGTALVPPLHDALSRLTRRAKETGAFVVVTTVYDFRNHKRAPERRWPLVDDYTTVDLVVTDQEEALRISGESDPDRAAEWFVSRGVGAAVVTRGPEDVILKSRTPRFTTPAVERLPISDAVSAQLRSTEHPHDTTGCGDNFVGGMLAAIASRIARGDTPLDLTAAAACGVVSGGFAATYLGGLYHESAPGEKRAAVSRLWDSYRRQVADRVDLPPALPVHR